MVKMDILSGHEEKGNLLFILKIIFIPHDDSQGALRFAPVCPSVRHALRQGFSYQFETGARGHCIWEK